MALKRSLLCLSFAIAALALAVPIALFLNWLREPFGPAEIIQSDRPLSLAEARGLSWLPYPDSASNIRFARFRQWIGFEVFVRFEAPPDDCVAFAERVISESDSAHGGPTATRLTALDKPVDPSVASSSDLNTDWFDVRSIRRGMVGGSGMSHSPTVWIDVDRGVCYYKCTD